MVTESFLPSLNGRIIDEGVAVGQTGPILRLGAIMLGVSLLQVTVTIAATSRMKSTMRGPQRLARSSSTT